MVGETEFMIKKKTILRLISEKGPLIPSQVYKEIEENVLLASALLSEMASEKLVKISSVKIGGSPLYYLKGQEKLLEKHIDRLHEKEKKAVDLLRQNNVLMDISLEPVIRVALRQVKDFAKAFEVKIGEKKEMFWKWHSFPSNELGWKVKEILKTSTPKNYSINSKQKTTQQHKQPQPTQSNINSLQKQQKIVEVKKTLKRETKKKKDDFLSKVLQNLEMDKLRVITQTSLRTNKESEFVVEIPSAVGRLVYYCKAINKKKCNDGDLSSAFVQGQLKKLPVLFLITGDLTKKAKEMLKKEFKGMVVKKVV
ncbi:hypothetical protein ISS04_00150 [Candidatus Woesearchaeota archaeon]|nr:hypothetical protein [Candidatus Woesearchaeota archaeon]